MNTKLIKEAVKEWAEGKLSDKEAMYTIMVIAFLNKNSKKCKNWAISVGKEMNKSIKDFEKKNIKE